MKKCIACDELIWTEALVCIYCWESLTPVIMEDGDFIIIPEHNYEKKFTAWTDNKHIYKDFLPIFWWTIIKEEPVAIKPMKVWSWISREWEPIETFKHKTKFIIKRKKSTVKPEIKEIESDFFKNLLWVSAKKFRRTYWTDCLIALLLMLWFLQLYYGFLIMGIPYTLLAFSAALLIYHIEHISAKAKRFEQKRNSAYKKFIKYVQELRKIIRSDVLDKYAEVRED
ncbi:MAG: hypothetical protein ACD_2C00071G0002 [uncultured bacterium (gcode 4)]|uniref:Uncharacterized protein n=1 Tax=uncultured bacterium (gcode 4) TaxID=1234023 RepID=K2G3Z1_9BACT|nr:MAG: hypothetical protein ACD_2C00071G0002 [uncultured bacterium (gcode 4)]